MQPSENSTRVYETPTRPQMRDLDEAGRALQAWLREKLPGAGDLRVVGVRQPSASGVANETLLTETVQMIGGAPATVRYAVRVDGSEHLFPAIDIETHYRLYQAMGAAGVPAPGLVGFEPDRSLLGDRFFVMQHVDGRVPPDRPNYNEAGWVTELSVAERHAIWRNFVAVMAQMHAVDPKRVAFLERPHLGASGLEQELRHWLNYADWCGAGEIPIMTSSAAWLLDHFPKDPPTEFAWGDARMQNVIFREDGACAAVLDWDMVSLAGPEADLAWHAISEQGHTASIGKPRLPGLGTPQAVVDLWQEITGRQVRDWHWHLAFAAYRNGAILVRLAKMLQPKGLLGPGAEYLLTNNGGMQWLSMLLDLPAPGPITRPFVGLDK